MSNEPITRITQVFELLARSPKDLDDFKRDRQQYLADKRFEKLSLTDKFALSFNVNRWNYTFQLSNNKNNITYTKSDEQLKITIPERTQVTPFHEDGSLFVADVFIHGELMINTRENTGELILYFDNGENPPSPHDTSTVTTLTVAVDDLNLLKAQNDSSVTIGPDAPATLTTQMENGEPEVKEIFVNGFVDAEAGNLSLRARDSSPGGI